VAVFDRPSRDARLEFFDPLQELVRSGRREVAGLQEPRQVHEAGSVLLLRRLGLVLGEVVEVVVERQHLGRERQARLDLLPFGVANHPRVFGEVVLGHPDHGLLGLCAGLGHGLRQLPQVVIPHGDAALGEELLHVCDVEPDDPRRTSTWIPPPLVALDLGLPVPGRPGSSRRLRTNQRANSPASPYICHRVRGSG
jgi:hypothetical protein